MRALSEQTAKILRPIRGLNEKDECHVTMDDTLDFFHLNIFQPYLDRDGKTHRTWASMAAQREFPLRFPERKRLDCGQWDVWRVGATDVSAAIIHSTWPSDKITFDPQARVVYEYLKATFAKMESNADTFAKFREWQAIRESYIDPDTGKLDSSGFTLATGLAPPIIDADEYELREDRPLAFYQVVAMHNSIESDGYGFFMEQGTGKTPPVITRICHEASRMREGKVDERALRLSVDAIMARADAEIRREHERIDKDTEEAIARKRKKLVKAAERLAAKRKVSLEYTGAAEMLLRKAREVVLEAEMWLGRRISEIEIEMRELSARYKEEAARRKAAFETSTNDAARLEAKRLVAPVIPGENRMYRALIVAPKSVRANWRNEVERFATVPGKVTVLRGGKMERVKLLIDALHTAEDETDCQFTMVIVSYETMVNSLDMLKTIEWDLSVLDEAHYIKSPVTKRHKASMVIRDCSRQRMPLTGTPIANSILDMFAQFEFMGKGFSGFKTWKAFKEFYGVYADGGRTLIDIQNLPFMKERMARYSFIVNKKEVLSYLPDKVYDVWEVAMTAEQTEAYRRLQERLSVEIQNDMDSAKNEVVVINNILTKLLRLAQITSGFLKYTIENLSEDGDSMTEEVHVDRFDPNPKLEALIEMMQEKGPNDKTIIWACWVQDLRSIAARLAMEFGPDSVVSFYGGTKDAAREEAERRFNWDPRCKFFVGNPAAGGTGLNLIGYPPGQEDLFETNCNHEVFYSQRWQALERGQAEDRAHRRGTREPVRITDLCVPGTIDEEIRARVLSKRIMAYKISDVREILTGVLRGGYQSGE